MSPPVITVRSVDPIGSMLGTGYLRFESVYGIRGLMKEGAGHSLILLVVEADHPGHGQFREFIKAAKAEYQGIMVVEVWNEVLKRALTRYEFAPIRFKDDKGEVSDAMSWTLPGVTWKTS